ncbi:MAG: hypothetical protein ACK5YM_05435 [Pseudomonadota bacterium]
MVITVNDSAGTTLGDKATDQKTEMAAMVTDIADPTKTAQHLQKITDNANMITNLGKALSAKQRSDKADWA